MSAGSQDAGRVIVLSEVPSSPFIDTWYDISTPEHFWFQWRLRATLGLLKGRAPRLDAELKALEIGCGTGVLLAQLEREGRWSIDGTDLDHAALARIPKGRGKIFVYDIYERREEFHEAYDVVVLYDVLEHIEHTPDFVDAVMFHLKPGGHLLLNVPALRMLFSNYDVAAGHYRRYDRQSLAREFEGTKLAIEEMRYWSCSMIPLLMMRKLITPLLGTGDKTIECGFKPPGALADGILKSIMKLETALLKRPWCGTSLLMLGRKQ